MAIFIGEIVVIFLKQESKEHLTTKMFLMISIVVTLETVVTTVHCLQQNPIDY